MEVEVIVVVVVGVLFLEVFSKMVFIVCFSLINFFSYVFFFIGYLLVVY